jgi:polygalacturonase
MRKDGGIFRGTYVDFSTDSYGHAAFNTVCAVTIFVIWAWCFSSRWPANGWHIRGNQFTKKGLFMKVYDPLRFGAKANGKTLSTAAIQEAIDACASAGGGTVRFCKGAYLTGTIFIRNGVTLQLDEGAILLGSTNLEDYPEFRSMNDEMQHVTQSVIYAEKVKNIAIKGKGEINGQGGLFKLNLDRAELAGRPFLIRMIECTDVLVDGITLRDSASWTQDYIACDNLTIHGIRVIGHVRRNNDGIDIDGCQNVRISDVETSTDDDGLCFKGCSLRPTRNVVVENCRFYSYCNSLKHGTDSQGGLQDVIIRNVELGRPSSDKPPKILGRQEGISGIALEIVDGGRMQNVTIENVKIRGTCAPIYLVLGDRGRHLNGNPRLQPGILRNVTISNVQAEPDTNMGCPVIGIPGHPIEDLKLRNIRILFPGGGCKEDTVRRFDEKADTYPESIKYAERLPAFGFFFWHVRGIRLENMQLSSRMPDERPALAYEDAEQIIANGEKI